MPEDYSDLFPGQDPDKINQLIADQLKKPASQSPTTETKSEGTSAASDLWPYVLGPVVGGAVAKGLAAAKTLPAIMAGPMAKFANQRKLDTFRNASTTPERAYDSTGWFKDAYGNQRFEISDKEMNTKEMPKPHFGVSEGYVDDFIDHPKLFSNYPNSKEVTLSVDPAYGPEGTGAFDRTYPSIVLGGSAKGRLTPKQQSALLHELGGHHVDFEEGFPRGTDTSYPWEHVRGMMLGRGSPEDFEAIRGKAFQMYKGMPSETNARNIQSRFMKERYGLSTAHEWGPQTTDIEHATDQFRKQGLVLEPKFGNFQYRDSQYPSKYDITSGNNSRYPVNQENLPRDLRALYDRLPIESGSGHLHPNMAGEFKYPWKTEDLPRSHQMDWTQIGRYEDIPRHWIEALRNMK